MPMSTPTTDVPPEADGPLPRRQATVWTYLGVATVLAVAIMWIWIFSGGPRKVNPDRVADREWTDRAEATCRATMDDVDERAAPAGEQRAGQRADAIDASTDDLEAMLASLADPLPSSDADRQVVEPWLTDWRSLLNDRRQYADALREDPGARFLTTEKFSDGLDNVIGTFADVNDMPSCGPAGDVG